MGTCSLVSCATGCYLGAQVLEHNGRAIGQAVVAELLAVVERHRARLPWLRGQGEALPCWVVLPLEPVKFLFQFRDGRLRQDTVSRSFLDLPTCALGGICKLFGC